MNITISKSDLSTAVSRVQGALSEKSSGLISLKAKDGLLHIMAADRALVIYCEFPCEVVTEGVVSVSAKFFSSIVRELPNGNATLKGDKSWFTVYGGQKNEFAIRLPLTETPSWRDAPVIEENSFQAEIPSLKLAYIIDQVGFCIAYESTRDFGEVGYLHKTNDGFLRLVGSDGYRLSYSEANIELSDQFLNEGICLTKKALAELLRMCHEGFDKITISLSSDRSALCAMVDHYRIYILLSTVQYPDYEGVIPAELPYRANMIRSMIQAVTKRVLLASGKTNALKLKFSDKTLLFSSCNVGSSEGEEKVFLDDYEGPECGLALNGRYLSDIFSATASEKLQFQYGDPEESVSIIPGEEPLGCRSKHVLVPTSEGE